MKDVNQLAYLALRHAQEGEARVEAARSQAEVAQATQQRDRLLLEAKRRQAMTARQQYKQLERLAGYLEDRPMQRVLIEGNTDSTGSAAFNQKLSAAQAQAQAQAVAVALELHGVGQRQYRTIGLGEAYPVPERRMKHAIEDLADACPGVQDIDNRIRVKR